MNKKQPQTTDHVIIKCPLLDSQRQPFLRSIQSIKSGLQSRQNRFNHLQISTSLTGHPRFCHHTKKISNRCFSQHHHLPIAQYWRGGKRLSSQIKRVDREKPERRTFRVKRNTRGRTIRRRCFVSSSFPLSKRPPTSMIQHFHTPVGKDTSFNVFCSLTPTHS